MLIFVPKENNAAETRISLLPDTVAKLAQKGLALTVGPGLGAACGISDAAYEEAGAKVAPDAAKTLSESDLVLRLGKPSKEDIAKLKKGAIHISYLDPFFEPELVDEFVSCGVSAIAMEMIPRTTLAQKMDALSSQANLAGYVSVIVAAEHLDIIMPMMMTPAGTLKPARVFIIGCGVAGLQAIATAKRLGARVDAFDTRPVVEEQVRSLGGKFVKVDLGETGQTKDGYAKALTEEQQAKQAGAMAKVIARSDVVITTAQLFGRKAPLIVTEEMVKSMRPGAVIVDLAVETGGNVAGAKVDEVVDVNGVKIVGLGNLPGKVALHASQMYSANIGALLEHFWDEDAKTFKLDIEDEIMDGCLIIHEGAIRSEMLKKAREGN